MGAFVMITGTKMHAVGGAGSRSRRKRCRKSCAYELVRQEKLKAVRLGKYVRVTPEALAKYIATAASLAQ